MNVTPRLLTTVAVAGTAYQKVYYIALFQQAQKIYYMTGQPLKQLLLRNLRKSGSVPEALLSTYINLVESMVDSPTHQEFKKAVMEPFLESCYSSTNTGTCDIPFNMSSPSVIRHENSREDVPNNIDVNMCIDPPSTIQEKYALDKQRYKAMRKWIKLGPEKLYGDTEDTFVFRLLSFNILAQSLLEAYPYLYNMHDKQALSWETRKQLLLQEILEAQPEIICLQEMQIDHLPEFLAPFKELGYAYLYKKRTNDKTDGLLLLYRSDQFNLLDYAKVELFQSGIELLSRDNVGIVAKLSLKDNPDTQVVIATTHLLYNPRRNDVRLGQTQILLAEIERIAFIENTMTGPKYLPIILSGDFNLEPFTGVYKFITEGTFQYYGKGRNLEQADIKSLSNSLIPPRLYVSDNCQHYNVLLKRLQGEGNGRVMLENSESYTDKEQDILCSRTNIKKDELVTETNDFQSIEIAHGHRVHFSSGTLTHPFNMQSVYKHINRHGEWEATTNQGKWITVDYIFYSNVIPVEKYTLPTVKDCKLLPQIPNFAAGSDHLCLGASFKIQRKK